MALQTEAGEGLRESLGHPHPVVGMNHSRHPPQARWGTSGPRLCAHGSTATLFCCEVLMFVGAALGEAAQARLTHLPGEGGEEGSGLGRTQPCPQILHLSCEQTELRSEPGGNPRREPVPGATWDPPMFPKKTRRAPCNSSLQPDLPVEHKRQLSMSRSQWFPESHAGQTRKCQVLGSPSLF